MNSLSYNVSHLRWTVSLDDLSISINLNVLLYCLVNNQEKESIACNCKNMFGESYAKITVP